MDAHHPSVSRLALAFATLGSGCILLPGGDRVRDGGLEDVATDQGVAAADRASPEAAVIDLPMADRAATEAALDAPPEAAALDARDDVPDVRDARGDDVGDARAGDAPDGTSRDVLAGDADLRDGLAVDASRDTSGADAPPDAPFFDATTPRDAGPDAAADAPVDRSLADVPPPDAADAPAPVTCGAGWRVEAHAVGRGTDALPFTGWEGLSGDAEVVFGPGVYELQQAVVLRSRQTICCMPGAVLRRARAGDAGAAGAFPMLAWAPARGLRAGAATDELTAVRVRGCTFDHDGQAATEPTVLVEPGPGGYGPRWSDAAIEDNTFVRVRGLRAEPIRVEGNFPAATAGGLRVLRNRIGTPETDERNVARAPNSISLFGVTDVTIEGNRVYGLGGIKVEQPGWPRTGALRSIRVAHNTIEYVDQSPVFVRTNPAVMAAPDGGCPRTADRAPGRFEDVTIEGNTVLNDGSSEPKGGFVVGAVVTNPCEGRCYYFRTMRRVTIRGNAVYGARGNGVAVSGEGAARGCFFNDDGDAAPVEDVLVEANLWDGREPSTGRLPPPPNYTGIPINLANVRRAQVLNNTARWSGRGLFIVGTDVRVEGNTLDHLFQARYPDLTPIGEGCISLWGALAAGDHGSDPLWAWPSSVRVLNNRCTEIGAAAVADIATYGVLVDDLVRDVRIEGNTFDARYLRCGAFVAPRAASVTASGNTIVPSSAPETCR